MFNDIRYLRTSIIESYAGHFLTTGDLIPIDLCKNGCRVVPFSTLNHNSGCQSLRAMLGPCGTSPHALSSATRTRAADRQHCRSLRDVRHQGPRIARAARWRGLVGPGGFALGKRHRREAIGAVSTTPNDAACMCGASLLLCDAELRKNREEWKPCQAESGCTERRCCLRVRPMHSR